MKTNRQRSSAGDSSLFRVLEKRSCELFNICERMDRNIKNVSKLSKKEMNTLWIHTKVVLIDVQKVFAEERNETDSNTKETSNSLKTIYNIVQMGIQTISEGSYVPPPLAKTATILHSVTLPDVPDEDVKDKISQFLEKWWIHNLVLKETIIINALNYLIQAAKNSAKHVQRLYAIKQALNLLQGTENIQELLKLTKEIECLSLKEGSALIVFIFSFGEEWIMGIHNNIKAALNEAKENTVAKYAELYELAWLDASVKDKKIIAENCIQDFVFHYLTVHRDSDGMIEMFGANLLTFLSHLCQNANVEIRKMISDQCAPLLWKHLKAPGSSVRCNAAEILFLAYPLQMPGIRRTRSMPYLDKQHKAMIDFLKDSDRHVCLIAIKGFFGVLAKHWSDLPENIINEWLNILLDHTKSSSYPDIRISVFNGLKETLSNPNCLLVLKELLPKFADSAHDTDTKVKVAFIELLLHIRDNSEVRSWDIVPLPHLFGCLEDKSKVVTQLIVKLLCRTIFASTDLGEIIKRISQLALTNSDTIRKFFLYCRPFVDYDLTLRLIRAILLRIKEHIDDVPTIKNSPRRRARKRKAYGDKWNLNRNAQSKSRSDESLNNPLVVQTLFDAAAIMWVVCNEEFVKETHKEDTKSLKRVAADVLPKFYFHFKGTPMADSILFLCSVFPESMVSDSTRFSKVCIRELYDPDVPDETVLTIVYLLVKWERVEKILKVLSQLFVVPAENRQFNSPKRRKVEGTVVEEKMLELGLRILKHLLHSEFESVLMNKYHQNLVKFWESMAFVKELIRQRLENCNKEDGRISERLLVSVFGNYISLIPILNETNVFDASKHFTKVLSWAQREIVCHMPQTESTETDTFSVNLLKTVFGVGNKMLPQFQATPKLCCEIVLLYSKCLVIPSGIIFVNDALITMTNLLEFNSAVFKKDESNLLSVVIPSLLTGIMVTMTKYSAEQLQLYTEMKDLSTFLSKAFSLLECTIESCVLSVAYMTIIVNTILICISKELTEVFQDGEETNVLDMALPYISDKLLNVTLEDQRMQRLFMEILENSVATYTPIDTVSALLIIHRLFKTMSEPPVNALTDITMKANICAMDESSPTHLVRTIESTRTRIIDAILEFTATVVNS